MNKLFYFIVCALVISSFNGYSADRRIPRFMSLKVSEANVRTGPGHNFPVKWILVKKHIPLEIIDSYDNWYKIKDEESKIGWIHKSLISRERFFVTVKNNTILYKNPRHRYSEYSLELGVRGKIKSCRSKWCKVSIKDIQGWIKKVDIWGVYSYEEI